MARKKGVKNMWRNWRAVSIDQEVDAVISSVAKFMRVSKNQVIVDLLKNAGFDMPFHAHHEFKGWNLLRHEQYKKWLSAYQEPENLE